MTEQGAADHEATGLDPADWTADRALAHRMVDDMIDYLATVRERPVWRPVPQEVKAELSHSVPRSPSPLADVYEEFKRLILPYPTGNIHPRFFGWVMGTGSLGGMLAEMLAAAMNPHLAGYDQSASIVEKTVIDWLRELVGYPQGAGGLLVSGGTMANINGLAVARHKKAGYDVRAKGVAAGSARLRVYGSTETHGWVLRACELMGLGREAFRPVPVDKKYRIDLAACRETILADLWAGDRPFCIVGNVGTVNTGAIDDLAGLRAIADEHDLWLHVDGAFGSLAALSAYKERVAGQELSDSIGIDLHKWAYVPFEAACVRVREAEAQPETFRQAPAYLSSTEGGIATEATFFADRGLELSRGFRALKVWMTFKEHGATGIGRAITRNIDQADYLQRLIRQHASLALLAPVSLNVVCFRYEVDGVSQEDLNALNREVLIRVQEGGVAVPSHTILEGRFALRVCITNHRTRLDDLNLLVEVVAAAGAELSEKYRRDRA